MKKTLYILTAFLFLFGIKSQAQKYNTRTGSAAISAESVLMDAKAANHQVRCILDLGTSDLAVSMLIKSFEFEKALMQTHFKADMESDIYPKATFLGKFTGFTADNMGKDGTYPVKVKGQLTLHGVTKNIEVDGKFTVKNGAINAVSGFKILLSDYKISVRSGVSNEGRIDLNFNCTPS